MSSKINVFGIVKGHFATLRDAQGHRTFSDTVTFIVIPALVAFAALYFGYCFNKELIDLLVNFGSIFTALLLSVLVLVYDQKGKCVNNEPESMQQSIAKRVLDELFYNISFSIVCSVALVVLSLTVAFVGDSNAQLKIGEFIVSAAGFTKLMSALIMFVVITIILNVLMIVKRMHIILTR